jgi:putative ABC transport system ATP-binding protein
MRTLTLDRVIPLAFSPRKGSEVWGSRLELAPGDSLLLHAPSGSGKSTLVSFLCAERMDYSGELRLGERSLHSMGEGERASLRRTGLSFVFQDFRLFPSLSALGNLMARAHCLSAAELAAAMARFGGRDAKSRSASLLEALGLSGKLDRPVSSLSRGERQRVAIARALLLPCGFLVLDEAYGALDAAAAKVARDLVSTERAAMGAGLLELELGDKGAEGLARRAL